VSALSPAKLRLQQRKHKLRLKVPLRMLILQLLPLVKQQLKLPALPLAKLRLQLHKLRLLLKVPLLTLLLQVKQRQRKRHPRRAQHGTTVKRLYRSNHHLVSSSKRIGVSTLIMPLLRPEFPALNHRVNQRAQCHPVLAGLCHTAIHQPLIRHAQLTPKRIRCHRPGKGSKKQSIVLHEIILKTSDTRDRCAIRHLCAGIYQWIIRLNPPLIAVALTKPPLPTRIVIFKRKSKRINLVVAARARRVLPMDL
jgi:hypothetical protein